MTPAQAGEAFAALVEAGWYVESRQFDRAGDPGAFRVSATTYTPSERRIHGEASTWAEAVRLCWEAR